MTDGHKVMFLGKRKLYLLMRFVEAFRKIARIPEFEKEVWICRGQYSDVYGVEEPPECYWAYTTERAEKEALKVYERHYGDIQTAITKIEEDRKKLGIKKYLDFAVKVNKQQKIMPLWERTD